jgi:hypothetical protein
VCIKCDEREQQVKKKQEGGQDLFFVFFCMIKPFRSNSKSNYIVQDMTYVDFITFCIVLFYRTNKYFY